MNHRRQPSRGVALLAALGVLALLAILIGLVQGTLLASTTQKAIQSRQLGRIDGTTSLLERALTETGDTAATITLQSLRPLTARLQTRPLAVGLRTADGRIVTRPGDRLATITWTDPPEQTEFYIFNVQGGRPGALRLAQPPEAAPIPAPPQGAAQP